RSSRRYCARVISVQAILISSGYRKPMNHNPLKSLNSFSVRHSNIEMVRQDAAVGAGYFAKAGKTSIRATALT
ncbi:hypothetical protein, partial [Komagataeibacter rhaeticus]|uniref:hypothetical protein n=1 Tax=Komagataeibacter rhaeticus TaxID=215221 RepID=UPI001CD26630